MPVGTNYLKYGAVSTPSRDAVFNNSIQNYRNKSLISLQDNRDIDAASGNRLLATNKLSANANRNTIEKIIKSARKHGVDPYTMLAIAHQETQLQGDGDTEWNPFHLIDNRADDLTDEGVRLFKDKLKIGAAKGKKTEADLIQAFNGYGKVGANTEGEHKSFYGIDVSKSPIDMNQNPVYGKRIVDIRDNIIKKNPELMRLVEAHSDSSMAAKKNIRIQIKK